MMYRFAAVCLFVLVSLNLTGCGGGAQQNGGSPTPPTPPPPPATADFGLTFSPASLSITPGSTLTIQIGLGWSGTPTGPVSVSVSGLTANLSAITPLPIVIPVNSSSASLTLLASSSIPAGTAALSVTGVSESPTVLEHAYGLDVTIPPPTALPAAPRTSYILSGQTPEAIVYDQVHKVLYVAEPYLNQVLLIDPTTRATIKTLAVTAPGGMDISPDGSQVVVASDNVANLTFLDTATQSVTAVVPFSPLPTGTPLLNPTISDGTYNPVFLANGDVLFIQGVCVPPDCIPAMGPIFRFSAATKTIQLAKGQPPSDIVDPIGLSRTPDGSKVLVITSQNQIAIYDSATDSVTATASEQANFAAADPTSARFAAFLESGEVEFLDTSLNHLADLQIGQTEGDPYALEFSLDGSKLFIAQSGLFRGHFAYETIDAVHYTVGQLAPLMNFSGNDEMSYDVLSEYPLAIDENNLIYGQGTRGIAIDDPLNYYKSSSPVEGRGFDFFNPSYGPVGAVTPVKPFNQYLPNTAVYFDGIGAYSLSTDSNGNLTIDTPVISTAGPANIQMVQPDGDFSFYPAAYTYGVEATAVEPAAGPPAGGIAADVLVFGAGGGASTVSVTVGGKAAIVSSVSRVGGDLLNPLPYYDIQFTVPSGIAGSTADVAVSISGNTSTLKKAFTYEPAIANYPFPAGAIPQNILYDAHRQQVYLLSQNRLDVFSTSAQSFMEPITVPTLQGKLNLTGMDISVDGSTLAVANITDGSIALINLSNPSSSKAIDTVSFQPYSVAFNSNGTLFVGAGSLKYTGCIFNGLYEYLPATGSLQQRTDVLDCYDVSGFRLIRSPDAKQVLLASPGGQLAFWSAATGSFAGLITKGYVVDGSLSADGTTIGIPYEDDQGNYQLTLDTSFNLLSSVTAPEGLGGDSIFGQFLSPSGALVYVPVSNGIDVFDAHLGTLRKRIGVMEPSTTYINQAATQDDIGANLYLITASGLDVINDIAPLSVRSVSPLPNTVSTGTTITLRGEGFKPGATVTFGGKILQTVVTDTRTLTFATPDGVTGLNFTLTNPDGSTYNY